jgi:hypothetical protein
MNHYHHIEEGFPMADFVATRKMFVQECAAFEHLLELQDQLKEQEVEELEQPISDALLYRLVRLAAAYMTCLHLYHKQIGAPATESMEEGLEHLLQHNVLSQEEYEISLHLGMILQAVTYADEEAEEIITDVRGSLDVYSASCGILGGILHRLVPAS